MATILSSRSIYYEDVNLIAQKSKVKSRSEIPKEFERIMVSPMSAIVGRTFLEAAKNIGISVCLHRFCSIDEELALWNEFNKDFLGDLWCAIGLDDTARFTALFGAGAKRFVIDTANGYMEAVVSLAEQMSNDDDCEVIAGNIHTLDGVNLYRNCRNLGLRIGISSGSACQTRDMTAINRGQISEIMECSRVPFLTSRFADGGVSNPGYAAMAFGAGATGVIMGGYFSKAEEAENVVRDDFKFYGSASEHQMKLAGVKRGHSEGKVVEVQKGEIRPLKVLVDELWGGIASATAYSGYDSLSSFVGNGVFEIKML